MIYFLDLNFFGWLVGAKANNKVGYFGFFNPWGISAKQDNFFLVYFNLVLFN